MGTVVVADGDTWQSISDAQAVPLSSLLAANGVDPDSPDPPQVGSSVQLPDDPPPLCAAPGHDHSVDTVPGETTLWIRLNLSADDARAEDGSLRLYSPDGSHDVTIDIAGHFVDTGQGTVDVLFDTIDPTGTYCIDYVASDGSSMTIVDAAPFSQWQDGDGSDSGDDDSGGGDSGSGDSGGGDSGGGDSGGGDSGGGDSGESDSSQGDSSGGSSE
jgi:hypothetical protein